MGQSTPRPFIRPGAPQQVRRPRRQPQRFRPRSPLRAPWYPPTRSWQLPDLLPRREREGDHHPCPARRHGLWRNPVAVLIGCGRLVDCQFGFRFHALRSRSLTSPLAGVLRPLTRSMDSTPLPFRIDARSTRRD
ncbi:hypothetical protein RHECNPAF_122100127 [Rhizobium etli CNPAF512]|nr:hypothetical protein RHECNPAF_122100127 [Rhizobium etli CNPAF512]